MSAALPRPHRSTPATFESVVAQATRTLLRARVAYGHGTSDAHEEATVLVAHALHIPLPSLTPAAMLKNVTAAGMQAVQLLLQKRIRERIPAAYLTQEAWLQGLRFYVDKRVIVPRSFIAEMLCDRLAPWLDRPSGIRTALDLCTGSACLAIILAKIFPRAHVDAVDLSAAALAVAKHNVTRYRLGRRIKLIESDLFSTLRDRRYDLIISNPPYVTAATMRRLPPEYRSEPAMALAGGEDGFELVDEILRCAAQHLNPNGLLVVEIGHHRRRLEGCYPRLPFIWPDTSGGDDCVFVLTRDDLAAPQALQRRPARRRAIL